MNALQETLRGLSESKSGHWGIVRTVDHYSMDAVVAKECEGGRHVALLHLKAVADAGLRDMSTQEAFEAESLDERLERFVVGAKEDGQTMIRCVITNFDKLSVDGQCLVFRKTRAVREAARNFTLQTVVCGSWNFFRMQDYWKKHLSSLSPVPDRKQVFFDGTRGREAVLEMLREAGCVSYPPSHLEEVCAEALLEVTGGDLFLLSYIVGLIRTQRQRLEDFETVIGHVREAGEVSDEIFNRAKRMGPGAWAILSTVVRQQVVTRPERDIDAEELRLGGFIAVRPFGGSRVLVLASPLIESILRDRWNHLAPDMPPVYQGGDLACPILALNTAAHRIIAQVENMLRNLVIVVLSKPGVSDWSDEMRKIKTGAYVPSDEPNENTTMLKRILAAVSPHEPVQLPPQEPNVDIQQSEAKALDVAIVPRRPKISIIESAEDWRQRQLDCTALHLSNPSLIYFLTTEDLVKSFLNKSLYNDAWKRFFPKRDELETFLEHYVVIRSATAHNQPITLTTLKRLEMLRDDLQGRICRSESDGT